MGAAGETFDSTYEIAKHAEKAGVTLAYEILNEYETNLTYTMEGMKRIAREITFPALKFCIDTIPVVLEGKTLCDYFVYLGERICHIHLTAARWGMFRPG